MRPVRALLGGMFRRKGRPQWPAARTNPWPERPAQWILLVVWALDTIGFVYARVRLGLDVTAVSLVDLVWFASNLVLSLLYRRLSRRSPT